MKLTEFLILNVELNYIVKITTTYKEAQEAMKFFESINGEEYTYKIEKITYL